MAENSSYIIVIGTSAGGLEALSALVSDLPPSLAAPVLVVQHLSPVTSGKVLVQVLARNTKLVCKVAEDGEDLRKGTIYLAPPDCHLVVKNRKIKITHGPHENRWRPSIDMLFRAAAAEFNSRTIGIILTGLLDDGTAGMLSVKRAGGTAIIQDPEEARYPDMPLSVSQNIEVDYVTPIKEMAQLLASLTSRPLPPEAAVPTDVAREAEISIKGETGITENEELGPLTHFTCPDCGGVLTETEDRHPSHYRCFTGHSYTAFSLLNSQKDEYESTLWVALRMMEERRNLLKLTSYKDRKRGQKMRADQLEQRAEEASLHIQRIRDLLLNKSAEEPDINAA